MTLADKLQQPLLSNFPHYTSNFNWSFYNLDDLAINKFNNFRQVQLTRNFIVYAGGPNDNLTETEKYIEGTFSGIYYTDKNKSSNFEKEFDTKLSDVRLFISHDGAYLLENYQKLDKLNNDEIAIFLEVPKDDVFSDNVMLIKAGSNAVQYTNSILNTKWTKDKYTLSEEQIKSLLEYVHSGNSIWSKIIEVVNEVEDLVVDKMTDAGVYIFSEIANFFEETIRLDEKRWNSSHKEYSLKEIEDDIVQFFNQQSKKIDNLREKYKNQPDWIKNILNSYREITIKILIVIEDYKADLQNNWAFICGLWNGLVDLLSGIFTLIKILFQGIKASYKFNKNEDYYKTLLLEYLDNTIQAILILDWKEVTSKSIIAFVELQKKLYFQLPKELWEKACKLNDTEINYYFGYVVFNILEFIIPPLKFAKLAKAGKLEKIVGVLDKIAGLGKQVGKKVDEVAEMFMNTINAVIKKLNQGTQDVVKSIDDIYAAVRKYLEELFGVGKAKVDNFVNKLPSYLTKFINALPSSVQKTIVDSLLILHFKGKTLIKIDPRGIILEINYTRTLIDKNLPVSQLKGVKLELKLKNRYGKYEVKSFRDDIEVFVTKNKNGEELISISPIYKKGKQQEAAYINQTFSRTEDYIDETGTIFYKEPPFSIYPYSKSKVIDTILKEGDEFFVVENLQQKKPGSWASSFHVKTEKDVREKLQILEKFKSSKPNDPIVVRKYKVKVGVELRVREGYVGNLKTGEYTGADQWQFIDRWRDDEWFDDIILIETFPIE
jgi:hypothetical protein